MSGAECDVLFVSRFPPPLGGVTVFARRKLQDLRRRGHRVRAIDLASRWWFVVVAAELIWRRRRQIIVNSINLWVLAWMWICGGLAQCVLYDHNASRKFTKKSWKKRLFLHFVRKSARVVIVHEHLSRNYPDDIVRDKVAVESPFVPPERSERNAIMAAYPERVRAFIGDRAKIKLVNSAWRYVEDSQGRDLYGIQAAIELVQRLKKEGLNVGLLMAFGDLNREDMPEALKANLEEAQEDGAVVVLNGQRELWPIFGETDVFLRLTSTDGESLSVLEARYFDCQVVASDVVPRPARVLVYPYGDTRRLNEVVRWAISKARPV